MNACRAGLGKVEVNRFKISLLHKRNRRIGVSEKKKIQEYLLNLLSELITHY